MTIESVFTNARIVLEDDIISGTLVVRDGRIASFSEGQSTGGEDMEGDYIIPGLVELHTDHLEARRAGRDFRHNHSLRLPANGFRRGRRLHERRDARDGRRHSDRRARG
nr:hypothetical protein [Thioclava sp.]